MRSRATTRSLLRVARFGMVMIVAGLGTADIVHATVAADLCSVDADPCDISTVRTITDQSVLDFGSRALRILNGGSLSVGGGTMTIRAGSVTLQQGGSLRAAGTQTLPGGVINVEAEDIIVNGTITVSGAPGGFLSLQATDQLEIRNTIDGNSLAEPNEPPADFLLEGRNVLITGNISGIGAGEDNAGGDLTINAGGDLEISSVINMSGGEGGIITLFAGATVESGGDIILRPTAQLLANGLSLGLGDGDISLDATGDGIEKGHIFLSGTISAIGRAGTFDTEGGTGGCVDISASGNVLGAGPAGGGPVVRGTINVDGALPTGSGGLVSIDVGGELSLHMDIAAGSRGSESEGGSVCIDVGGDANIFGSINVNAGNGGSGDVTIESDDGAIRIESPINASASFNGRGGAVCLASGGFSADRPSSVIANAAISANGSGTGAGGAIELDGTDVVQLMAPVSANGGTGGGIAGSIIITVSDGNAILQGALNGIGSGNGSAGGVLTVDAEGSINAIGPIDVSGRGGAGSICSVNGATCQNEDDCPPGDICRPRGGGLIDLTSTGPIDLNGPVRASSTAGGGGRVDLLSDADIRIGNSVVTDGTTIGGRVDALGCMITVCGQNNPLCAAGRTGSLSSRGSNGINRLTGRGRQEIGSSVIETSVIVLGSIVATAANQLVFTAGGEPPVVFGSAMPTANSIPDSALSPCPVCGNGATEDPEECDDGNQNDGDGCSSTCRMEESVPGDVNGDQQVNANDVEDLILEIFDGDGELVTMVSSPAGTFPGNPGADANRDGLINAADVNRTINLLGTP